MALCSAEKIQKKPVQPPPNMRAGLIVTLKWRAWLQTWLAGARPPRKLRVRGASALTRELQACLAALGA
jgi:hypothetical protein